jgi:hypothetical protein
MVGENQHLDFDFKTAGNFFPLKAEAFMSLEQY